eukprot:6853713-Pyramimonas_sp.AAC.1
MGRFRNKATRGKWQSTPVRENSRRRESEARLHLAKAPKALALPQRVLVEPQPLVADRRRARGGHMRKGGPSEASE